MKNSEKRPGRAGEERVQRGGRGEGRPVPAATEEAPLL